MSSFVLNFNFIVISVLIIAMNGVDIEDRGALKRIRECCIEHGKKVNGPERCLDFCRFNTTNHELEKNGVSCSEYMSVWMFCAAEGQDNSKCCRSKKVPEICMGFCRGDLTQLCKQSLQDTHFKCITRIRSILECHAANLNPTPLWTENSMKDINYTCLGRQYKRMVKILANGDIVNDDDPRVPKLRHLQTDNRSAGSRHSNAQPHASSSIPHQSADFQANNVAANQPLLLTLNQKLLEFGIPRWSLSGITIEPIYTIAVLLMGFLFGIMPTLILIGILYVFTQLSRNNGDWSRVFRGFWRNR